MTELRKLAFALVRCGSAHTLLELLRRHLLGDPRPADTAGSVAALACTLAAKDPAFAESLADAICVYLQREASNLEKVGLEFDPLIEILAALKLPRTGKPLMDWIDRHRWPARPAERQEQRFAKAIWALMTISPTDSRHFLDWWMERAAHHADDWAGAHFDPEAVKKP